MPNNEAQLIASLDPSERHIVDYIDRRLSLPEADREEEWDENIKPLRARRREIINQAARAAKRAIITIPEEDTCPTD